VYRTVTLVGCGGVGSWLAEAVARYLASLPQPPNLVIVDGDAYSRENAARQRIGPQDIGVNKAIAIARRLSSILPELSIKPVDRFLGERNAAEIIGEESLTIAAPDNHATRLAISRRCQRLRNGAAVFAGNEMVDGAVQVYVRRNGRELQPPPERYHPEIAMPRDRSPAEMSCEEIAARPGGGQVIFANFTVAAIALNVVYALLHGRVPTYTDVFVDVEQNRARATTYR